MYFHVLFNQSTGIAFIAHANLYDERNKHHFTDGQKAMDHADDLMEKWEIARKLSVAEQRAKNLKNTEIKGE